MKTLKNLLFGQILLIISVLILFPANVRATVYTLDLALYGQNEVPPNPSPATGMLTGSYDDATNVLSFNLMFNGLVGLTTASHFHGPAAAGVNGPVVIPLVGFPAGVTSGSYSNSYVLTPGQESDLLCGMWYINIHSTVYPGGEIRSQVKEGTTSGSVLTLELALSGQKEVAPNFSTATGILTGTYDEATNLLSFTVMFNGLTGPSTAAHFHGPAFDWQNAGVQIALAGFPVGVTSGNYVNAFVLTDVQESQLLAGMWYLNIHSQVLPGGEIRGQITEGTLTGDCAPPPPIVPVANWALLLGGLLIATYALFIIRRRG